MNNYSLKTTSRQLYDTTISGQHPVSNQVTQSESKTDNTDSVSNLVSNSVSTAGARAYARACACAREGDGDKSIISPDELEAIRNAYVTNVGQQMTAMVAREIEEALAEGMRPSVVIEAAITTGNAPRPTPYYMRAVLRRWRRDGILTDDALAADRAAFEQQQARAPERSWWQNPALRYEQRPINNDESLFTDLSAYLERRKSDEKPEASSL